MSNGLLKIYKEKIQSELNDLLTNKYCDDLELSQYLILLSDSIIPEFKACFNCQQNTPYHYLDVMKHIIKSVENIEPDLILKLTMLFHDIAKPQCKVTDKNGIDHFYGHPSISAELTSKILKRLKYPDEIHDKVVELVLYHDYNLSKSRKSVKKLLKKLGYEQTKRLLKVRMADVLAQSELSQKEHLHIIVDYMNLIDNVSLEEKAFTVKNLAVNGEDIMKHLNIPSGKIIGTILNFLLEQVIAKKVENNSEALLILAKKFILDSKGVGEINANICI